MMDSKPSLLAALSLLAMLGTAHAETPRVVTTVQPVQQLVAAVTEGVTAPEQLVKGSASPHDYSLRPSDMRNLSDADVVFLIGPALESFLNKPLDNLEDTRVVVLMEAPGVEHLAIREGGAWEAHDDEHGHDEAHADDADGHDETHAEDEAHGHDHDGSDDTHVWLDPHNAKAMVNEIARVMGEIDSEHAETYQANAQAFGQALDAVDEQVRQTLAPVSDVPYVVFHDAYHYFEAHYGLSPIGSITVDPEQRPGAQRVQEIRDHIRQSGARCVFSEPQFTPALVQTLVADTGAGTGVLDPLGSETTPDGQGYLDNLTTLADALVTCLADQ